MPRMGAQFQEQGKRIQTHLCVGCFGLVSLNKWDPVSCKSFVALGSVNRARLLCSPSGRGSGVIWKTPGLRA